MGAAEIASSLPSRSKYGLCLFKKAKSGNTSEAVTNCETKYLRMRDGHATVEDALSSTQHSSVTYHDTSKLPIHSKYHSYPKKVLLF